MARPRSTTLTPGELRIMEVLWKLGEASVQQVTDALGEREPLAYNTALTMLRILKDKQQVEARKEGKAHIFVPLVSRDQARSSALAVLLKRFFDDSPQMLAQHLVREGSVGVQELEQLKARVADAKKRKRR